MNEPWSRTAKIKTVILLLCALPNLFFPPGDMMLLSGFYLLIPFLIPTISLSINWLLFSSGKQIIKPHWNDSPLDSNRPLSQAQFAGLFFLCVGFSIAIGSKINHGKISDMASVSILFGLGFINAIRLTLLIKAKRSSR